MSTAVGAQTTPQPLRAKRVRTCAFYATMGYLRRNPALLIGILFLTVLLAFVVIGHFTVDTSEARPLSRRTLQPPSRELPFGTDKQGRNLYAVMVTGTP